MMNEEDKQRIREEEEFRLEVRMSLAQEKTAESSSVGLWTFFNSTFGIWVLSTIFISCFGWVYTQYQASRENSALIDRLEIEIEERLHLAEWTDNTYTSEKNATPSYPANVLLYPPSEHGAIQPEFTNRSFKSLLHELRNRLPIGDRYDIDQAITQVRLIEAEYLSHELTGVQLESYESKVRDLLTQFMRTSSQRRLRHDWYDTPLFILLLIGSSLMLIGVPLYGLYHLFKWLQRKAKILFWYRSWKKRASTKTLESTGDNL